MGTRADFYVGRGENAEWVGSIAWDGYPSGVQDCEATVINGTTLSAAQTGGTRALTAKTETDFREGVAQMGSTRDDFTDPAQRGWPRPWEDSATTDYAYAYDDGKVYASGFGSPWFEVDLTKVNGGEPMTEDEDGNPLEVPSAPAPVFPNMRQRQQVRFDKGSGLMIF